MGRDEQAKLGFTSDELQLPKATVAPPPAPSTLRSSRPILDETGLARCEAAAREVIALDGCTAVAVIHEQTSTVIHGAAEPLVWTLGAALEGLDDARADVFACTTDRCHLARRLGADCFVYASFDLAATSLALARRSFASALERL
jgi:hypothetical protein